MKKLLSILLVGITLVYTFVQCEPNETEPTTKTQNTTSNQEDTNTIDNIDSTDPEQSTVTVTLQSQCGTIILPPPIGTQILYKLAEASDDTLKTFHVVTSENQTLNKIITNKVKAGKEYDFNITTKVKTSTIRFHISQGINLIYVETPDETCLALNN